MRVNSEIKTNSIKIVNLTPIVECTVKEGLRLAQEQGLDLVEVADGNPSICKIMDYQKYLFDKKKHQQKIPLAVLQKSLLQETKPKGIL